MVLFIVCASNPPANIAPFPDASLIITGIKLPFVKIVDPPDTITAISSDPPDMGLDERGEKPRDILCVS